MSIKKALLIVAMTLSALAALAPASALAEGNGTLTDPPGTKVVGSRTIGLTGVAKMNTLGSSIECTVHAKVTYDGDSAGEVHEEFTISTCVGKGATFAGCQVAAITNTPAGKTDFTREIHLTKTPLGLLVTNKVVSMTLKNCTNPGDNTITISFPKGVKTLPPAQPIKSLTLSSSGGTMSVNGGANLPCAAEGTLEVTGGAEEGTYIIS
jgi:hypothetical protein